MTNDDELLTPMEAAAYLHTTENSLRSMRSEGMGPPVHRPDGYHVRYRKSELDAYHAACGPSPRRARMNMMLAERKRGPSGLDTGRTP